MSWGWSFHNSGRTDIDGYIQGAYRMPDARELDKPHTNAQETFIHRTYISGGVRSKFWTCQLIRLDKTDITWHATHSPHEELTRNACERNERTENFTVRYASASTIREGVTVTLQSSCCRSDLVLNCSRRHISPLTRKELISLDTLAR